MDTTLSTIEAGFLPGNGGDFGDGVTGDGRLRSNDGLGPTLDVSMPNPMGPIAAPFHPRPASSWAASSSLRVGSLTGDLVSDGCKGICPQEAAAPLTEGVAGSRFSCSLANPEVASRGS